MQRDTKKRKTSAVKEIKKNSMPFIGLNKSDLKGKTMIEKKSYNLIAESYEKLDEQNEDENEEENQIEKENEKKPTEKEK